MTNRWGVRTLMFLFLLFVMKMLGTIWCGATHSKHTIRFNELEIKNIAQFKQERSNFVLHQMVEYFGPFSVWSGGYDGDEFRQGPRASPKNVWYLYAGFYLQ